MRGVGAEPIGRTGYRAVRGAAVVAEVGRAKSLSIVFARLIDVVRCVRGRRRDEIVGRMFCNNAFERVQACHPDA